MYSILKKEIAHFFSSLTGYLSIGVFLLLTGLVLWIFPGDNNILDYGYSSMESFFYMAPILFLILIPAVTMRSFSEEKNLGTIELLMTKPVKDMDIILGKFLASFILVIFAILPTFIYFWSISKLGAPEGNIDTGGVWGSYLGLLFLAGAFTAIGIFASSIATNQIVSFILSILLSAILFWSFDLVGGFPAFQGGIDYFIQQLGMNAHYVSISKGVVDTRDVIYFLSIIIVFVVSTKTVLESRKW
jgi:ABC-2 type transport system permease protein